MPHKKRSHGHHKKPKESQTGQATPKAAAQVSTVKPAQFEKASAGSTMASKPGVVTTTTGSGVTAGGSAAVGTTGKEAPKAKAETAPASQVKAAATAPPAAAVTKPKELPKDTTKTAAGSTVKPEAPKVDPAKTSKPAPAAAAVSTATAKATESTKVQVEGPSTQVKASKKAPTADDPFDDLASLLPSAESVTRPEPKYTGPEVKEHGITSEKGVRVGERDDTLPPGYRFENVPPVPADVKPKEVPKPLSTDDALDALSSGFTTSTAAPAPKKQEKRDHVESISAASTAPSNFAAPPAAPGKKAETPAPPADKKAKMETTPLKAGIPTEKTPAVAVCPAPPVDKKPKMDTGLDKKAIKDTKLKTEKGDSMSLDALGALGDTLAAPEPKPEPPKLRPQDIVPEDKLKKEKGVRVGETEDSIPPEYRFKKEEQKHLPALKPEPSLDTADALDILSGDFSSPCSAPVVQAPVVTSSAPSTQKAPVVKGPAPPVDKKGQMKAAAGDFSLEAGISHATAQKVESSALPPRSTEKQTDAKKPAAAKDTTDAKPKLTQGDSMSLDALGALGDTLAAPEPKPEPPKLRPQDIVTEDKVKKEKGVRVGEREDSIPPEYRFKKEDSKKLPVLKPEPSLDTAEALDLLSGDFSSPCSAPVVQAPSPQAKVEDLSALDVLAGDFVAPTKTGGVHASAPPSTKTPEGDSMSLDALGALGDTLAGPEPKPEPPKLRPQDIVVEDKVKKEKGVRVGEREDSILPEYRFKKEEPKQLPVLKPEPSLDTAEALDMLSGDFVASCAAPTVKSSACPPVAAPPAGDADNAMDALSDTLKDIAPTPKPEPPLPKNIVKEKKLEEERLIKMGERDDTLPPEYRPTAEDRKKMEEAKNKVPESPKEKTMDDKTALDLLSGDFSAPPTPPAPSTTTTKLDTQKPMAGPVLDKSKTDKPKKPPTEDSAATDVLSTQLSSDVVPKSTKKGGKS